jgi:hypothetical protein
VTKEIIRSDMSRVFEYGVWRDQINVGITNSSMPTDLAGLAAQFFKNSAPPGVSGSSPQTVMYAMMSYMNAYTLWADMVPVCFDYTGPGNSWNNERFQIADILLKYGIGPIETTLVP